ncbi:MAG: DNA polymerase III subunit chi [Pseudomonadota bacterium]
MTDVMFYHLERQGLEQVLPKLLEKTLERGWTAVVQAGSKERVDALNDALWTYREDSFLPHGRSQDGFAAHEPIYLTEDDDTPNGAQIRFMVDGAHAAAFEGFDRIVFVFDGADGDAVARAREDWKRAKEAGCVLTYWQQDGAGRWIKKA